MVKPTVQLLWNDDFTYKLLTGRILPENSLYLDENEEFRRDRNRSCIPFFDGSGPEESIGSEHDILPAQAVDFPKYP
jgi:hypothetical protein